MAEISLKTMIFGIFLASSMIILPSSVHSAADVAIYNDTALQDGGAWATGINHIKSMLSSFGYSYEDITPNQINVATNLASLYKVLLVPGGWAGGFNTYVNSSGMANIRNFVGNGGSYIGICAGAYFACNNIIWQGTPYTYYLNLFSGTGVGSLGDIIDWYASTGCQSEPTKGAKMTSVHMTGFLPNLKSSLSILYFGGPAFTFSEPDNPSVVVVARYSLPGSVYNSKPAMIYFPYGSGRVFLSGPHPEVSFNNCQLSDTADNWEIIRQVLNRFTQDKAAQSVRENLIYSDHNRNVANYYLALHMNLVSNGYSDYYGFKTLSIQYLQYAYSYAQQATQYALQNYSNGIHTTYYQAYYEYTSLNSIQNYLAAAYYYANLTSDTLDSTTDYQYTLLAINNFYNACSLYDAAAIYAGCLYSLP